MAECRAWVASLQAFVMEVDMQVPSFASEPVRICVEFMTRSAGAGLGAYQMQAHAVPR